MCYSMLFFIIVPHLHILSLFWTKPNGHPSLYLLLTPLPLPHDKLEPPLYLLLGPHGWPRLIVFFLLHQNRDPLSCSSVLPLYPPHYDIPAFCMWLEMICSSTQVCNRLSQKHGPPLKVILYKIKMGCTKISAECNQNICAYWEFKHKSKTYGSYESLLPSHHTITSDKWTILCFCTNFSESCSEDLGL